MISGLGRGCILVEVTILFTGCMYRIFCQRFYASVKDGMQDFVIYDKLGRIGGAAWVTNANPTSKLQTELGVYHLQCLG